MTKKIVPRISGGLGNQLFIYATARRLALISNCELALDDISGFANDILYKRRFQLDHFNINCRKANAVERLEPFSRIRRYCMRKFNKLKPFAQCTYLQQEGVDFDQRLLHVKPQGTTYLEGCWQSEGYFKDVEDIIRQDLKIIPPNDSVNLSMASQISGCIAVAVHVRFFDDFQTLGGNNAPSGYYGSAVDLMERTVSSAHYFIFSDKPEFARAQIPLPEDRITLVVHNRGDENAYADLWLMTLCQHFIIANSTFSWWGAWLAENPTKQVIAPGFEVKSTTRLTAWGFKGLLPNEWIKL